MADICRAVRLAVKARLASDTYGFNVKYSGIQSSYDVPDLEIDWSEDSKNFVWGRVPPDLIEASTPLTYPLLTITAERGQQDPMGQRIKFRQFSGTLLAVVEVHLSWAEEQVTDFETWPEAVIDAMFQSINDPNIPNNWGAGLVFGGDLNFAKGPILMAGQNWRRTVTFPCSFKVIA